MDIFLSSTGSSRLAGKLKTRFLPAIADALEANPGALSTRLALDFYISGIVSLMGVWLGSAQEASASEVVAIVDGVLHKGVLSQLV